MKVLLITVGSRGDAEPYCAMANSLLNDGHSVDFFLQKDLLYLAPKTPANANTLTIHELPFTQMDFYKFMAAPTHGVGHPNPRVQFIGIVTDTIAELVFPCHPAVTEVAAECDWIVCSSLARPLALAVGKKFGIKTAVVHLQPLAPTTLFPHYSLTQQSIEAIFGSDGDDNGQACVPKKEHQESYFELEKFQYDFLEERLDAVYDALGTKDKKLTFDDLKIALTGKDELVHIINCFSNELVPSIAADSTLGPNIHETGAVADDYIPPELFGPPVVLTDFLSACEAKGDVPICIGFGSMPFDKVAMVLDAVQESGKKAVFVGGALQIPDDYEHKAWADGNVCQVSSVPYAWLLPKCSMMLSHGGAGVLHASARAGIPALIAPLMGDQMYWGDFVEKMGIGARCCVNLSTLTKDDVVEAIRKGDGCIEGAREIGMRIRAAGSGIKAMMKVLNNA
eukprot:CAMPEP_0119553052 /NCGR_PEP_ID=MMETSP1352-20130426/5898_1 /TAXON_ID=265584 /ORGANISM="Stauroneis constricta, Strain CCMP1120" /LENGTH=451 /DNA_ID=CAMNT_0007599383 /DNA_START=23 /DNA_END=1378 /DNA_ORIENTATION=-